MTDWLLGTLLATSALIVMVLLVREPVRAPFRRPGRLWPVADPGGAAADADADPDRRADRAVRTTPSSRCSSRLSPSRCCLASVVAARAVADRAVGGWPTILLTALAWALPPGCSCARMSLSAATRGDPGQGSTELGRIGSIRLVRSPEVRGPIAFGIFDRVIAVPADFDRLYDDRERRLALDHELAHHRSGDLVANFFAFVLLCLQWFNPLAWVAHAAFRFDQEAACDARVLDKAKARRSRRLWPGDRQGRFGKGAAVRQRARSTQHPAQEAQVHA